MYQFLNMERNGPVVTVTLNRPEALNALNREIMSEIEICARSFIDDDALVVIFKGAGRHFSAGADLKQVSDPKRPLVQQRRDAALGSRMLKAIQQIPQVTIAAIHGAALGGGACIPTACDFRVGADDCYCGYPEVNLGMNLMWHAVPLCVQLVGSARAKRMIMLGEKIPAPTLYDWGFLDELVANADLDAAATAMAERYAGQPPVAVQMIKQSINQYCGALDNAVMHMDADQNLLTASSEDRREGVNAFFEGRKARYSGN